MVHIDPFPDKKYKLIYADPAWTFKTYSDKGKDRSAEKHYKCMTLEEIQALPVQDIAEDDCVLLMWVTWPCLQEGLATIKAWGFEYKTCGFSWAKKNKSNLGFHMGMGFWTRANTEVCLLATRGKPKRIEETGPSVRQLVVSPVREHSRKPDEMYGKIEDLVVGPYIELFSRTDREGWDFWGDEIGKFGGEIG